MGSDEILDLIHTSYSTMDKIEFAIAMRQLGKNTLNGSEEINNQKHPGFHVSNIFIVLYKFFICYCILIMTYIFNIPNPYYTPH